MIFIRKESGFGAADISGFGGRKGETAHAETKKSVFSGREKKANENLLRKSILKLSTKKKGRSKLKMVPKTNCVRKKLPAR